MQYDAYLDSVAQAIWAEQAKVIHEVKDPVPLKDMSPLTQDRWRKVAQKAISAAKNVKVEKRCI